MYEPTIDPLSLRGKINPFDVRHVSSTTTWPITFNDPYFAEEPILTVRASRDMGLPDNYIDTEVEVRVTEEQTIEDQALSVPRNSREIKKLKRRYLNDDNLDAEIRSVLASINQKFLVEEKLMKGGRKGYSVAQLQFFTKKLGIPGTGKKKVDVIAMIKKILADYGMLEEDN